MESKQGRAHSSLSFSAFMTSPGCSNMLSVLLNCFLGRARPTDLLVTPCDGEAFPRFGAFVLENNKRGRGALGTTLPKGFFSWGGDPIKHSSREMLVFEEQFVKPLFPAPNVNWGSSFSLTRGVMIVVERHFVRLSEGRFRLDFLRLWAVSKACNWRLRL
jgi:hypothetical protein